MGVLLWIYVILCPRGSHGRIISKGRAARRGLEIVAGSWRQEDQLQEMLCLQSFISQTWWFITCLGEKSRRVRMTHKIGKIEDLWGMFLFFSYMREMRNINNSTALGIQNLSIIHYCVSWYWQLNKLQRHLHPSQVENSKFQRSIL